MVIGMSKNSIRKQSWNQNTDLPLSLLFCVYSHYQPSQHIQAALLLHPLTASAISSLSPSSTLKNSASSSSVTHTQTITTRLTNGLSPNRSTRIKLSTTFFENISPPLIIPHNTLLCTNSLRDLCSKLPILPLHTPWPSISGCQMHMSELNLAKARAHVIWVSAIVAVDCGEEWGW